MSQQGRNANLKGKQQQEYIRRRGFKESLVSIFDKWEHIRQEMQFESHEQFARTLLDMYVGETLHVLNTMDR